MSNYVKSSLGASESFKNNYQWNSQGVCIEQSTGKPYPGDQKLSNCYGFHGPPPSGTKGVVNFLTGKAQELIGGFLRPQTTNLPQATHSTSSLVLPAVIVVGGVGLLLILKKKK